MKTKKISKKLALGKSTITNLDNNDMNAAHGGGGSNYTWGYTCDVSRCASECATCFITDLICP